jgi:hypothetical protein
MCAYLGVTLFFYLVSQRDLYFDCRLLSTLKTQKLSGSNAPIQDVFELLGQPHNAKPNYIGYFLSKNDVTYFYCAQPFFDPNHPYCEGFKITTDDKGSIHNIAKRGYFGCNTTNSTLLFFDPTKDQDFFAHWFARVLKLQFPPSEHYLVESDYK